MTKQDSKPAVLVLEKCARVPYTEEQGAGLTSLLLPCSSNMKRAASLNYLNQPNAAPLQVRVLRELPKAAPGAAGKVEESL